MSRTNPFLLSIIMLTAACVSDASPAPPAKPAVVITRGKAVTSDLAALRAAHDAALSKPVGAGHRSHHAAVSAPSASGEVELLLVDETLGADETSKIASAALSRALFSAAPDVRVARPRAELESWGPIDAVGDGAARFLVVLGGDVKDQNTAAVHNEFFGPRRSGLSAAGYERHHAFSIDERPSELVLLGVWTDGAALAAAGQDPQFGALLGALFAGPPSLAVFATQAWAAWQRDL